MIIFLLLMILYCTVLLTGAKLLVNNTLLYGWQLMFIYIISSLLFLIKYRKKTLINPEFLFSIVFFFSTFLFFPLLYNSTIDSFIFRLLANETDVNLIRSQSIAVMSYLFYLLGGVVVNKRKFKEFGTEKINMNNNRLVDRRKVFHIITTVLIVLSMIGGGYKILYRYTEDAVGLDEIGGLFSYITIFLVISSVVEFLYLKKNNVESIKNIFKHVNILYVFNIIFMSVLFLAAGYRSAVFPILIPLVFLYDIYIKRINKALLVAMLLTGFILMSVIKETRIEGNVGITKEVLSLQNLGGDFVAANKALYFFVDHTDNHGSQHGKNAILQMVSFIPFAQSVLINQFGFESSDTSSKFFTEGVGSYWSGLGTHVIGDLYYSFGLFGTIFWMFLLGIITNLLFNKIVKGNSVKVWEITAYLLILGNSLMFPRVEFFFLLRNIGFSIIIIWLFQKIFFLKG